MEAIAIQAVANDVGHGLIGLGKGSEKVPEEAFSVLVEKIIADEKNPSVVSSEDVTPALGEGEEKSEKGDEEISPSFVAAFVAEPEGVGTRVILDGESSPGVGAAEQNQSSNPLGKELAPGLVELRPSPADSGFSDRLVQLVTQGPASDHAQDASPNDILPRPADSGFAEALSNLVTNESPEGRPTEVPPLEVPSGLGPANVEEAPGQLGAKVSDVGEAQESLMNLVDEEVSEGFPAAGPEKNPAGMVKPLAGEERNTPKASERLLEIPGLGQLDQEAAGIKAQSKSLDVGGGDARWPNPTDTSQNQGLRAEEGIEASFSVNIDSQEETLKTAPMPSTPKETVGVEAVKFVSLEEAQGAELEPVEPANGGSLLQSNDRSAESLELAKSLSQPHSASAHETSAAGRPPAPPVVGRIVDKMVEVIQAGGPQERHEVSIQLNPPSLGKVQLTVLVEDSKLHVALFTTTSEARELVESNASQLRAALNEQGLMLEQFSVGVRSELAHNMPNQEWLGWQDNFGSGRFFQAPGAVSQEPAAGPRAYQRSSADSRIDLFI